MIRSSMYGHWAAYIGAFLIASAAAGCGFFSGSRGGMKFDELKYPVSMSAYLYGPDRQILAYERDLPSIKKFTYTKNYWGTFYTLLPLSGTLDISRAINDAIQASGGDGIVNMKIIADGGFMTYLHPFTILPIWPSYTVVTVEGDIVKFAPRLESVRPALIPGNKDVLIIEATDSKMTVDLHEQCRAIGKVETLFANQTAYEYYRPRTDAESWGKMTVMGVDGKELDMQSAVTAEARKKSANVAQIIYLTFDRREFDEKRKEEGNTFYLGKPGFARAATAIDIRYWACP